MFLHDFGVFARPGRFPCLPSAEDPFQFLNQGFFLSGDGLKPQEASVQPRIFYFASVFSSFLISWNFLPFIPKGIWSFLIFCLKVDGFNCKSFAAPFRPLTRPPVISRTRIMCRDITWSRAKESSSGRSGFSLIFFEIPPRSSKINGSPLLSMRARSTAFCNSRTFPGHW